MSWVKNMDWKLRKKQFYNEFKRDVALTLCKSLLGKERRRHLSAQDKQRIGAVMRELDNTFKEHGIDWKLTE